MKIAILYICTGPYRKLFPDFYTSVNEHFFKDKAEKTFFVWTDTHDFDNYENVKVMPHQYLGFPLDSLLRFNLFLQAKEELLKYGYIYFFNSNTLFLKDVEEEILPKAPLKLACRVWKNPIDNPMFYSIEKDKKSTAYVPPYDGPYLNYSGGITGGDAKAFIEMSEELAGNIRKDWVNGIIAQTHDQSHLNYYFHYHKCKVITPEYSMPGEQVGPNDDPSIIFLPKQDNDFNKHVTKNARQKFVNRIKLILIGFAWYLKISVKSGQEKYIAGRALDDIIK